MNFLLIATEADFFGDRNCKSTRKFEAETLPDILLEIEIFLKGCGYQLKNLDCDIPSS